MPELLGTREIALPSAGAKTNELIANHVYTRGFVLLYTCIIFKYLTPTGSETEGPKKPQNIELPPTPSPARSLNNQSVNRCVK